MREGATRDTDAVSSVVGWQAGGSCGTHGVRYVIGEPVGAVEGSNESSAVRELSGSDMMQGQQLMKAKRRLFPARRFKKTKGVYNWRKTEPDVMRHLLALVQCVSVVADIPLAGRSSVQIRSELRSRLAKSLAQGDKERAFAKACGFSSKPRANDPEGMMRAFPGLDKINWKAAPVQSGINADLWRCWHARHCERCSQHKVHKDCYFKPIWHFLRTGFEPSVATGFDIFSAKPSRVAYVDKWREEEARCRESFAKWQADSSGLMSAPVSSPPKLVFPLLPVVRAKDAWRHEQTGKAYKVRLCVDFKNGGFNDMLDDWPFCYWGLESVAETVSQGDWLASIDISRFYLRLPAGERLKQAQWFQDPDSFGVDTNANERLSDKKRRYRQLRSVAFGLKPAPAFASVVSAEAKRILESFGISVAGVYIDDFLIRAATKEQCEKDLAKAISILTALGIPPNEKTQGPCAPHQGITFLGVRIRTADCSMSVTEEHRRYSMTRVRAMLKQGSATLRDLESVCGILSWIAQVYIPGRPRRDALFQALGRLRGRGVRSIPIRGELKRQLQWWFNVMKSGAATACSHFWDKQPEIPLMCSDASGEDGWGVCVMGMHIVGDWPEEWKQSAGSSSPSMLFKELVPPVIATLLLAPLCKGKVFAAATDNAGVAFVLNSMSCKCPMSLALLRPLADSLAKHHIGLIAGHAHRHHNKHADALSHALPQQVWKRIRAQAAGRQRKKNRMEFHFVVHDMQTKEAFAASMSFPRVFAADAPAAP